MAVFGLVLTGKPTTRAGWVDTGVGAGQAELPMGYPRQSLVLTAIFTCLHIEQLNVALAGIGPAAGCCGDLNEKVSENNNKKQR